MSSRRVLVFCSLVALAGYVFIFASGLLDRPIRSDGFSYYVYLPSWFLYHDASLDSVARDCCGGEFPAFSAIVRWPATGRWVNAHPIGVAVMQAPLFLIAHALTRWTNLSPDGFTLYYQHAAGLSGTLAVIGGLTILRALLRRHFSDRATAVTLIAMLFATNLYHYATFDSCWSHAYSFLLFASCMYLVEQWHADRRRTTSWLLGLDIGLIVLTRHPNLLFPLLVFPLYGVHGAVSLRARMARLVSDWRQIAIIVLVALAVVVPQVYTYFAATGRPLISAYGSMGFTFGSPRIFGVLFGVAKGVFFWSPILLCACAGLLILARSQTAARGFVVPGILFIALQTYLIASWGDWQFGASFGHRGFTDTLPVFAIGLAAFYDAAARRWSTALAPGLATALSTALSIFLMTQYWYGRLPFSDTTWDQYKALFR